MEYSVYMPKQKNIGKWIMTVFFAMILITSILGFALSGTQNTKNIYNKNEFVQRNDLWITEINDEIVEFIYYPDTTLDIEFDDSGFEPLITYIVSNPALNLSTNDLQAIDYGKYELKNTLEKLGYENNNLGFSAEYNNIKPTTCEQSTPTVYVIDFQIANETSISRQKNCIILAGKDGQELLRAKDRFVYGITKII